MYTHGGDAYERSGPAWLERIRKDGGCDGGGERVDGRVVDAGASGDCGGSAVDVGMVGGLWW